MIPAVNFRPSSAANVDARPCLYCLFHDFGSARRAASFRRCVASRSPCCTDATPSASSWPRNEYLTPVGFHEGSCISCLNLNQLSHVTSFMPHLSSTRPPHTAPLHTSRRRIVRP